MDNISKHIKALKWKELFSSQGKNETEHNFAQWSLNGTHCQSKMLSAKQSAKYLLAILLGLCSLWQCWEICLKFFGRSTTIARAQHQNDYLPLPKFLLCQKDRYNTQELSSMGLPENFLDSGNKFNHSHPFPDLNATWQRATWPLEELEIDWNVYEGLAMNFANSLLWYMRVLSCFGRLCCKRKAHPNKHYLLGAMLPHSCNKTGQNVA